MAAALEAARIHPRAPLRAARWCGLIALVGCQDFTLDPEDDEPTPPQAIVTDAFVQEPASALDLLVVVDDTASMSQEQAALASAIPTWTSALDAVGVRWQAGVTTTDTSGEDAGWLLGNPYVLSSGDGDALAARVTVGTDGQGPEAGFAAAIRAIELAADGGPNRAWRRADAALWVLFLSDADDSSDAYPDAASFVAALPAGTRVSAIVGDPPSGCVTVQGSAKAGHRYLAAVEATDGISASICAPDFSGLADSVADAVAAGSTRFDLRATPIGGSVRVEVDGDRVDAFRVDGAAVVFDEPPAIGAEIRVTYLTLVEG